MQLTDALQDLYASLGLGQVRKITSTGTTTSSIDTTLNGDGADDGALIVVTTTDAAAPQGEFGRITAFAQSTNTWTHDAFTVATAAGDYVMSCRNDIPIYDAVEVVNRALVKLGDLDFVDTTTLDTASSQREYTYAVAWKHSRPTRVDIQTNTGDSDNNQWEALYDWEYIPASANNTGLLVFRSQPTASRDLRIWYPAAHARVDAYSDYIDERFHRDLVKWAVKLEALEFMVANAGRGVDPLIVQLKNDAEINLDRARSMHPIHHEPARATMQAVE